MLAHETIPALSDRLIESRRPWTADVLKRLCGLIDGLRVMTDGVGDVTHPGDSEPGFHGHNHGYGFFGLQLDCITREGTLERGPDGAESELLGRHISKQLVLMACASDSSAVSYAASVTPAHVDETPGWFGHPLLDVQFLADPGTKNVTVTAWLLRLAGEDEVGGVKLRVATAADYPRFAMPGAAPGTRYAGDRFSERFAKLSTPFDLGDSSTLHRVSVTGVAVAPGRYNRLRLHLVAASGTAAVNVYQLNVSAEENNG